MAQVKCIQMPFQKEKIQEYMYVIPPFGVVLLVYMPASPRTRRSSKYAVVLLLVILLIIQVQKSFNMDVGMHHVKNRGNKEIPLTILSRILAQSCLTLCLNM